MTAHDVISALNTYARKDRAQQVSRYFKTGKGEYGEGDVFIGVTVPQMRTVALKHTQLSLSEIKKLLTSPIHEHRFTALLILDYKYTHGDDTEKEKIYTFYTKHTAYINNWDLVDTSASCIVGAHLYDKSKQQLYTWATSTHMWQRRIAIVATHYFIHQGDIKDALLLTELLLADSHDLMHKAVGWTLREVGKKNEQKLKSFLMKHYAQMARTTLRYAIERFGESERKRYLNLGKR